MKQIFLKQLTLTNFKGLRSFTASFGHLTNILGRNSSGKTTLKDAFLWLLFGKDSTGRTTFEIKTIDGNGQAIEKIDHEVEGIFEIDGEETTIKRIFREKWVKKRGALKPEMEGHEQLFYWNDVPLKESEFKAKVNALIDENLFRLITNPNHFNSLKWQDRRAVLVPMARTIRDEDIAAGNDEFLSLLASIKGKTMEEYRAQLAARKKKLNDDLKAIPTRIDEANRSKPEPIDADAINQQITTLQQQIAAIDAQIADEVKAAKAANDERLRKQNEIFQAQQRIQQIKQDQQHQFTNAGAEREREINTLQSEIRSRATEKNNLTAEIIRISSTIDGLEKERTALRDRWHIENEKQLTFDEHEFVCPACQRAFEAADIDAKKAEMTKNFNEAKAARLAGITERGKSIAAEVQQLTSQRQTLTDKCNAIDAELSEKEALMPQLQQQHQAMLTNSRTELDLQLSANEEIKQLNQTIATLQAEVNAPTQSNTSHYNDQKAGLQTQVDALNRTLAAVDQIAKIDQRIEALYAEESNLSQQLADLEKTEFTIAQFTRARIDAVESRINGMFSYVRFRLFDTQINGAEVECCDTLVNSNGSWVPFTDANNAARINGGVDIINTLCRHYGVYAPIFIDNRESVTELIPCDSQVVNLIVSDKHKTLSVQQPEPSMAEAAA